MDNDMHPDNVTVDPTRTGTSMRKGLTIGLTAGLLGGAAAGFAFGVPGSSGAASPEVVQQTEDTVPAPEVEPGTRLREALQPLVDDGTITAEQADAVVTQLRETLPVRAEGHGHRGGPRGGLGRFLGEASDALAELFGIDEATLRQELGDGSTLADIANANGVEVQTVIDTLVAAATEQIDQSVADGEIDEARAEELKATLVERMTDRVNGVRPERPPRSERAEGEARVDAEDEPADTEAPTTTED